MKKLLFLSMLAASFLNSAIFGMQPLEPVQPQHDSVVQKTKNGIHAFLDTIIKTRGQRLLDSAKKTEQDTCPICKDNFDSSQNISILQCNPQIPHTFHTDCLQGWINQHPNCPTCRKSIENGPIIVNPANQTLKAALIECLETPSSLKWELGTILLGLYIGFFNHLANQSTLGILRDSSAISIMGYQIPQAINQIRLDSQSENTVQNKIKGFTSANYLKAAVFTAIFFWAIVHNNPGNDEFGFLNWYFLPALLGMAMIKISHY